MKESHDYLMIRKRRKTIFTQCSEYKCMFHATLIVAPDSSFQLL